MTRPLAGASIGAFSSRISACNRTVLEQIVDARARLSRHRHERHVAAVFFWHDFLGHQFLLDALGVGLGLIDPVDVHHQRHASLKVDGSRVCGITPSSAATTRMTMSGGL